MRHVALTCLLCGCLLLSCKTMQMPVTKAPFQTDDFLKTLLWKNADARGKAILSHPDKYHLQIIYVAINRDSSNHPSFREYRYHVNPDSYFYPASAVKMPIALTALEKINLLHVPGLTKYTPMFTDSVYPGTPAVIQDTSAADGMPSVAQYIKKIFLVSDNDAANRLYEFTGQQQLNRSLHDKGYKKTDILHRLDISLSPDQNRHTNPVSFRENGREIYAQPEMYNPDPYPARHDSAGLGYMRGDQIIREPMDFSVKNRAPLGDLLHMLQSVIFPESVPEQQRFRLTEDDRRFLYQYMSEFPGESKHPAYDPKEFPPAYVKFVIPRDQAENVPPQVRSFSKSGWAYGFLTDIAYIADFQHRVEYMLAATLYVNNDGIINDDAYDYEKAGKPFLAMLGRIIYQHELHRARKYLPGLARYSMSYRE